MKFKEARKILPYDHLVRLVSQKTPKEKEEYDIFNKKNRQDDTKLFLLKKILKQPEPECQKSEESEEVFDNILDDYDKLYGCKTY